MPIMDLNKTMESQQSELGVEVGKRFGAPTIGYEGVKNLGKGKFRNLEREEKKAREKLREVKAKG